MRAWIRRNRGGLVPSFWREHDYYRHHLEGGEQTRRLSVTWLWRSWVIEYTSEWKAKAQ